MCVNLELTRTPGDMNLTANAQKYPQVLVATFFFSVLMCELQETHHTHSCIHSPEKSGCLSPLRRWSRREQREAVMVADSTKVWRQWRKQAKFKLRVRKQRFTVLPTCVVLPPHMRDFKVNSIHSSLTIHVAHYTFPGVRI